MRADDAIRRARARFWVVTIALAVVGLAGYLGAHLLTEDAAASGTFALAAATGFAAFFSPCSWPLLLTLLVRRHDTARARSGFVLRIALGAASVLMLFAIAVALAGAALATVVAFDRPAGMAFRFLVGGVLVLLGLRQMGRISWMSWTFDRLSSWARARVAPDRVAPGPFRDVVYGATYVLIGSG